MTYDKNHRRPGMTGRVHRMAGRVIRLVDGAATTTPGRARQRVFPARWSMLFGHVAFVSFLVLVVSGLFLTLWYEPSMETVVYDGSYRPLRGVEMSEAYASTVELSFEVRGGLLMRQVHSWATHIFVASLSVHMLQMLFTGAFRRPWRLRWLLVLTFLVIGIVEAYIGNALPDDLLTGTGLRVTEGVILAIPLVGTYVSWLLFGGEFPGDDILARLNVAHVGVLPLVMVALFAVYVVHSRRVERTHGTGAPESATATGRREEVGAQASYPMRIGGFMTLVTGVIVVLAATIQLNPVWLWGPFDSAQAAAGSQPPWYLAILDGGLRLMPAWDITILGHELNLAVLVPAVVIPGLVLTALAAYPWIEEFATGGRPVGPRLDRPRDMPVRTGLGAAFIAFYLVLWIGAGNDVIATIMNVPLNWFTRALQIGLFVLPVLVFIVTKRICLGLQLRDLDTARHGRESGVIMADSAGAFTERHARVSASKAAALEPPRRVVDSEPEVDANGVLNPRRHLNRVRERMSRFYFGDSVDTTSDTVDTKPGTVDTKPGTVDTKPGTVDSDGDQGRVPALR